MASLCFRIFLLCHIIQMPGGMLQKSFKKVRTREEVARTLWTFFGDHASTVCAHFLQRLQMLREALEKSFFFSTHEVSHSKFHYLKLAFGKAIPVLLIW